MRIAFFTNEYPPNVYGGAGVHVEYLSRELAALEEGVHAVDVFSFGEQHEDRGNLRVRGIPAPPRVEAQDPRHGRLLDALARNLAMAGAAQAPDIELFAHARTRSVTIEKQGNASLTVRAEPDGGNVVDVRAPKANGRKTLRNVEVDVHAEARIAEPGQAPRNNPPPAETRPPR